MKRLLFVLVLCLIPSVAYAGTPTYSGYLYVPNGANLTFQNGASGCVLSNNGVTYVAACPVGTVAFSAAAPFTVTGTGPYVIGCPTCFTTSGGTISGATTFSNTATFNGTATFNATPTINGDLAVGTGTANDPAIIIKQATGGCNSARLGWNTVTTTQGIAPSALGIYCTVSSAWPFVVDLNGNGAFQGQVTATQFNVGSKRAYKYDIHPLPFDAVQVLHHTDFATFRYRPKYGDPRLPHIGIIADDSPSAVSGEKHDHLDIEALAAIDGAAIVQLDTQIKILFIALVAVTILLILTLGVALRRRA